MKHLTTLAATIAAALSLAPAATAARPSPAPTTEAIAAVARIPWTTSRCYGRELVQKVDAATINALAGIGDAEAQRSAGNVTGLAYPATCTVVILAGLSPRQECTVDEHEFGHLAGLAHSDNPLSIMFAAPMPPTRCYRFARWPHDPDGMAWRFGR
jgi:hypothetical protein